MSDRLPASIPRLVSGVERVLAERGPLGERQLVAALTETGLDLGVDPAGTLADLLESDDLALVLPLVDGRFAFLPALLDGRVFTHRVSKAEVEYGLLAVEPDLAALSMLFDDPRFQRLVDGRRVVEVLADFDAEPLAERGIPVDEVPAEGAVLLPADALRTIGLSPGDLVGVRVTRDGWALERVAEPVGELPAELGQRLGVLVARRPGEPQQTDQVVWTACAGDPEAFRRPLPALGEIFDRLGLVRDGDQLAAPGFDFPGWRLANRIQLLRRRHELNEDEALAVLVLVGMYRDVDALVETAGAADDPSPEALAVLLEDTGGDAPEAPAGGGRAVVRATVDFLDSPEVAEALLAETIGAGRDGAAALGLFAESLEPMARPQARAALHWLAAKALERMGEVLDAEARLSSALEADPGWVPALYDMARYASDRGQAAAGLALLRRAGAGRQDRLRVLLEHFGSMPAADTGRNKACWCGSGRKYKVCHLGREQLPLAERAAWLYQKAGCYLQDGPWRDDLLEVADERSWYWETDDALLRGLSDPLVADAVLFEGGAFEEFLAERGVLLPDDERLLGEQWLLVDRSVYEVEAVRSSQGLTVRDLRTGDRLDVRERTASRQLTVGALLCARIVPAGDTMQIFGGCEPIALAHRDELIALLDAEPDPAELVAFLSRRFAPPVLANTEGEPLVLCEATVRPSDPAALAQGLDRVYARSEEGPTDRPGEASWTEYVTTRGMERIRATLRLDGGELRVQANSETRFERVLDLVRSIQPAVTMVTETRQPIGDIAEAMSRAPAIEPGSRDGLLDPNDPAVAAVLGEVMLRYEDAWLDDSIPALDGYTPRQAAADPTRRDDLIRLLDSFPSAAGQPGLMDPDRLRHALDLPR